MSNNYSKKILVDKGLSTHHRVVTEKFIFKKLLYKGFVVTADYKP